MDHILTLVQMLAQHFVLPYAVVLPVRLRIIVVRAEVLPELISISVPMYRVIALVHRRVNYTPSR